MKKILSITIASILFAQSFAFAAQRNLDREFQALERKQQVQEAVQEIRQLEIKDLNLNDLEKGLSEMRLRMAGLKLDLKSAQKAHDGRMSVKLRNYGTMSLAGLTVLGFAVAFAVTDDVTATGVGSTALWILLPATILFGVASFGYVHFTSEELRDFKASVEVIEAKIESLEEKVIRRKLELRK